MSKKLDFSFFESNTQVINSNAWKIWLIHVLRTIYPHKEANNYSKLIRKLLNYEQLNKQELIEIKEVLNNPELKNIWQECINDNVEKNNLDYSNINAKNIISVLWEKFIYQKILLILWLSCDNYNISKPDIDLYWEEIYDSRFVYVHKIWNKCFILDKETKEREEYDYIEKKEDWFLVNNNWKFWFLDLFWSVLKPCEYDLFFNDVTLWAAIKKWDIWEELSHEIMFNITQVYRAMPDERVYDTFYCLWTLSSELSEVQKHEINNWFMFS